MNDHTHNMLPNSTCTTNDCQNVLGEYMNLDDFLSIQIPDHCLWTLPNFVSSNEHSHKYCGTLDFALSTILMTVFVGGHAIRQSPKTTVGNVDVD